MDSPISRSQLGTPVYDQIIFEGGTYDTDVEGVTASFPELRFDAVLISVTQNKNIVRTQIQGRDGTVKEYVGQDDFRIKIDGLITGDNGVHPKDEINDLKAMLDAPISIKISCDYLTNLGITDLVVDSYEIGQQAGGRSYQQFSITAYSDEPLELRLSNV